MKKFSPETLAKYVAIFASTAFILATFLGHLGLIDVVNLNHLTGATLSASILTLIVVFR